MRKRLAREWLLILAIAIMVTACEGTATEGTGAPEGASEGPAATPSMADAGRGGEIALTGAGSSFVNPFFSQTFAQYSQDHPNIKVNYQSIGSGGGIKQFTAQTVDFGASDVPMNDEELAAAQQANGNVVQIPVALGAVAVIYNLPGVDSGLKLTPDALANIFLGRITKWNNPAIAEQNPDVELPDQDIAVVHRSDGSGTTFIFTDYLSNISPEWQQGPGTAKEVAWPLGIGGKGNEGVAAQVQQTPGSIGYVELAYALEAKLTHADLQNKDGQFVGPSLEATTAAAAGIPDVSPTNYSIVNAPGAESYPIVGYTWAFLWEQYADAQKATALTELMTWVVTDAQNQFAEQLNYAPLPDPVRTRATDNITTVQTG
jgi:phosphate transport system substrate-binding protein